LEVELLISPAKPGGWAVGLKGEGVGGFGAFEEEGGTVVGNQGEGTKALRH
jgi:hypothetical protein